MDRSSTGSAAPAATRIALRRFTFDASSKRLSATVAGKRMRLAELERNGFDAQLNARFATPGMFQAGETLARIIVIRHAN